MIFRSCTVKGFSRIASGIRACAWIDDLLQSSIQAHARVPDAIRLNPFTVQLLKITEDCCDGRYRGLIPLVPDPQLDANTIGIDYL